MLMRLWNGLERVVIGTLTVAALLICLWQIAGRYISAELTLVGGEELAVYLIIWAALLTASGLVATDGHVRADLILRLLPTGTQRWIEILNCALATAYCAGLAWYGYLVSYDAYDLGERSMTSLGFPMWVYYAALPVSAALMTLRYAIRLFRVVAGREPVHDLERAPEMRQAEG